MLLDVFIYMYFMQTFQTMQIYHINLEFISNYKMLQTLRFSILIFVFNVKSLKCNNYSLFLKKYCLYFTFKYIFTFNNKLTDKIKGLVLKLITVPIILTNTCKMYYIRRRLAFVNIISIHLLIPYYNIKNLNLICTRSLKYICMHKQLTVDYASKLLVLIEKLNMRHFYHNF